MIIYKITNNKNTKIYIGLTSVSLQERWTNHKSNARNSKVYKSALYSAMRKYGITSFSIEQIDTATSLEELNAKEISYIKELNTLSPNGYNLDNGGGSQNCHPETRAKIATALKGQSIKNRMNGAPKGRPVSAKRRAQISATMTGVPQPWKYKKVICNETGVVYESIQAAAKASGIERSALMYLLKSGGKSRSTKLSFKYY